MSFERGMRRIILAVSIAIGLSSVTAVGLELSAVARYQAKQLAHAQREERFQAWLAQHPISDAQVREQWLTNERFNRHPARVPDLLDLYLGRGDVESSLRWEHARQYHLEDVVNPPESRRVWWDWQPRWLVLLGFGIVTSLTTLPWGTFYLLAWIVRGFRS